jgi:hypothetical protein
MFLAAGCWRLVSSFCIHAETTSLGLIMHNRRTTEDEDEDEYEDEYDKGT